MSDLSMSEPPPTEPAVPYMPVPDLPVVEEMQLGIVSKLADIQVQKAAGKKIVWCSVLTPKEILYAMDVPTVSGNLLGAYASIFGLSGKYCQLAEEDGLARDVCSVNRCGIGVGCCEAGERDAFFDAAFAVPDVVIVSNFPCTSESKASLHVARKYNLPYYVIDTPINTWGKEIPEHAIKHTARQLQGMIDFLEEHGYHLDPEKLREEVLFTRALNTVMEEIDLYKRAVPLPIRAYDAVIAMTAPLALSKEARKIELFERLRDQLKERVAQGYGIVENEKLRLLWLGLPPLFDFGILDYPTRHGAVVAKHMLEFLAGFSSSPERMDPEHPLESIAHALLESPANPTGQGLIDYFVKAVKDYRIDGVIAVVMRSCGLVPGIQRITKEAVFEATGVPSVIFDLDGGDQREYDGAATRANLDAFIETLLARKGA